MSIIAWNVDGDLEFKFRTIALTSGSKIIWNQTLRGFPTRPNHYTYGSDINVIDFFCCRANRPVAARLIITMVILLFWSVPIMITDVLWNPSSAHVVWNAWFKKIIILCIVVILAPAARRRTFLRGSRLVPPSSSIFAVRVVPRTS